NLTYWVQCTGDGGKNETRNTTEPHVTVDGLAPGSSYDCSVWVERDGVSSSRENVSHSTDLRNTSHTNSSVTLIWSAPEDPYSYNYTYWVQWASEGEEEAQGKGDPARYGAKFKDSTNESSYECVGREEPGAQFHTEPPGTHSTSGGYGVILTWSCPSGGYETFEVEVGRQRLSRDGSFCGKGVSVSDLGPAQSYMATITTLSNGLKVSSTSVTCYTESAGVIVGAIVGILLLFILVGLLIFFLKRRRGKKSQQKEAPKDMVFSFPGDILAKDFADYVRENERDSSYGFAKEYQGLWSSKEFIATQGPLPHTVGDFWRLVWEQQSHTLVKCEHYWPLDAQPCTHGQLQVTLINEEVKENWTVRDLQLFHVEEKQTLSVRQFHYVAWPDHGVPYSPDPLLAFQKVLRQWLDQSTDGGPPIVHCSAGVGRTGTLIALDVLLRQLECKGLVGPFNFVKKMRENRPLMVQTEAQYVFLHQCILRSLQQSAPAPILKEATYENVANFIFENEDAIRAHESETSASGC
ncbi:hypothetical protein A6R68_17173, partial [Neotoma lepida]